MKFVLKNSFFFCLLWALNTSAQDPQFSQFYANPIYLNPAYTGSIYSHRAVANYRNQWLGISSAYSQYAASYDYNAYKLKSGFGMQFLHDVAGTSLFKTTSVVGSYAYRTELNKFIELGVGFAMSLNFKRIDFDRLVFNDQLFTSSSTSQEQTAYFPKNYLDFNSGVLLGSLRFWAGVTVKHLNKPNIAMSGGATKLPILLSFHGGYRFIIKKSGKELKKYISPSFNFRHQQNYDQLDVAISYFILPLEFGVCYRGLPIKKYDKGYLNQDALILLFKYDILKYNLRIGYSYDLCISKLIFNTSGSHEFSLIYEIIKSNKKFTRALISTSKF